MPIRKLEFPQRVLLFSGHMIDSPDRLIPRFPLDKVPVAEAAIRYALAEINANRDDLGLTQGAAGGDLIFAEICQDRGVTIQFMQPFAEPDFIEQSVAVSSDGWKQRYLSVKRKFMLPVVQMPDELLKNNVNPYEACNRWLLDTALRYGAEKVCFICLWDGKLGDNAGGTSHMAAQVKDNAGQVIWIDTKKLW